MSEDKLLSSLKTSKIKNKTRTEKIRETIKELQHEFSKSEIKEIKKKFYEIENKESLSTSKETKRYLLKLEGKLSRLRRYYDHDDVEYKGIKDIECLFDLSIGKDYYKPIITKGAFSKNYIQYESRGDKDEILTVNEYLDMIRLYLVDMINDHKTQSEWKIHQTIAINFISSKPDSSETCIMHAKSDNIEITISSRTDEVIEKLFESLLKRCQKKIEESMRGSEFVFDGVNALYYDFNKISLNRGKSYIDSPEWLKNKKATINSNNNDDNKCFQYALTIYIMNKLH